MSSSDEDELLAALVANKKRKKKKEEEEEDEDVKPSKRKKPATKRKAAPKKQPPKSRKKKKEEDEEGDEDGESDDESDADPDEDDDDDDDFEDTPKAKKRPIAKVKAKAKGKEPVAKRKPTVKKEKAKPKPKPKAKAAAQPKARQPAKKKKVMSKLELIDQALRAYKWWEAPALPPGRQWNTIEHNGVNFPPEYEAHGIKLLYDQDEVELTPEQEEVATFYANMPPDGPQLGDPETAKVFTKNFFADFKELLGSGHVIKKVDKCDFTVIQEYLANASMIKKAATDEDKASKKAEKERLMEKHGFAIVDGHLEKVGNYTVEPPGLFRGRGKHPKTGKLKTRVFPSQISINVGEGSKVPQCPIPGYAWKSVQHDPTVTWLANWKENVGEQNKYVMLAASSSFKGKSDKSKYDKAMRLKGHIEKIRADYESNLKNADKMARQIATAVWVIDKLALRVGGEKGEDEADTVGCCSLRLEHLQFMDSENSHEIELKFLGKDSMLYQQVIDFDKYGPTGLRVFKNLEKFCKSKRQQEDVFDSITPQILNQHLQGLMPGLTAKVFRTYNASETLELELPENLNGLSIQDKVVEYNNANREVAILCNHQKTVSSAQIKGLEGMNEKLELLKSQRKELKDMKAAIKANKPNKIPLKSTDKSKEEAANEAVSQAKQDKANAKNDAEKIAATLATEAAKQLKRDAGKEKQAEMHLYTKVPTEDQIDNRIKTWGEKIKKLEIDIRDRDQNKEVALGTSKINYMDPRISVAWCKRHEVPIEKVFAKTLREKFVWAMNVPPDWKFSYSTLLAEERGPKVEDDADEPSQPAADVKEEDEEEDDEEAGEEEDDEAEEEDEEEE